MVLPSCSISRSPRFRRFAMRMPMARCLPVRTISCGCGAGYPWPSYRPCAVCGIHRHRCVVRSGSTQTARLEDRAIRHDLRGGNLGHHRPANQFVICDRIAQNLHFAGGAAAQQWFVVLPCGGRRSPNGPGRIMPAQVFPRQSRDLVARGASSRQRRIGALRARGGCRSSASAVCGQGNRTVDSQLHALAWLFTPIARCMATLQSGLLYSIYSMSRLNRISRAPKRSSRNTSRIARWRPPIFGPLCIRGQKHRLLPPTPN